MFSSGWAARTEPGSPVFGRPSAGSALEPGGVRYGGLTVHLLRVGCGEHGTRKVVTWMAALGRCRRVES